MTDSMQAKKMAGGAVLVELVRARDFRGSLAAAECGVHIPFAVERCFWVYGVPGREIRGEHAHRQCHQFLVCVQGSCTVTVDSGTDRADAILGQPTLGLYLPPLHWAAQHDFSEDAVLLVAASHRYDAADYIRDYQEFLSAAAG